MNIERYRKRLHKIIEQIYNNHDSGQDYDKLENLAIGEFYDLTFELIKTLEEQDKAKLNDKNLLTILNELLTSANKKAWRYWRGKDFNQETQKSYQVYRDQCYKEIWDEFWNVAKQTELGKNYLVESNTSYEENMTAFYYSNYTDKLEE